MDFLSRAERSTRMARIRKKNTTPELIVRRIVHGLGHRYRLHCAELPGTPDLVLKRLRKIVEVRGCFWHSHACRKGRPRVASRIDYWHPKLARNQARDKLNLKKLRLLGWQVLVIWECETRRPELLTGRLQAFLDR